MELLEVRDTLGSMAFIAGRRAGKDCLSPSLNPHPDGTAEHAEWERGRMSAAGEHAAAMNRIVARGLAMYDGCKHEVVDASRDGLLLRDPFEDTHVFLAPWKDVNEVPGAAVDKRGAKPCIYQSGHTCDCGGIGRCLDVA